MTGYGNMMSGGGIWGLGLFWLLTLIVLGFGIVALIKYFRD